MRLFSAHERPLVLREKLRVVVDRTPEDGEDFTEIYIVAYGRGLFFGWHHKPKRPAGQAGR